MHPAPNVSAAVADYSPLTPTRIQRAVNQLDVDAECNSLLELGRSSDLSARQARNSYAPTFIAIITRAAFLSMGLQVRLVKYHYIPHISPTPGPSKIL